MPICKCGMPDGEGRVHECKSVGDITDEELSIAEECRNLDGALHLGRLRTLSYHLAMTALNFVDDLSEKDGKWLRDACLAVQDEIESGEWS